MPSEFLDDMYREVLAGYRRDLAPIEGAADLARSWPGKKAVASSSSAELVKMKLERVGLASVFGSHVYTADTLRGKPHPDVYVHAAGAH